LPRTARQAIRSWYATHPKTFCPVVGQSICPSRGCENPTIREDPRCNIELKQSQAALKPAESDELRGWIYDLRDSSDGRRYLLNFGYNRALLDDFRRMIPATARRFDPETREWAVDKTYASVLRSLFQNFDRFLVARYDWLNRQKERRPN